jgi:hypothetical protein
MLSEAHVAIEHHMANLVGKLDLARSRREILSSTIRIQPRKRETKLGLSSLVLGDRRLPWCGHAHGRVAARLTTNVTLSSLRLELFLYEERVSSLLEHSALR